MRASVLAALPSFTARFEGRLACMYLDNHKASDGSSDPLVTCATGNLIDPVGRALTLPWQNPDGSPADADAIAAEWNDVKSRVGMAAGGGGAFMGITSLRLSSEAIDALLDVTIEANESTLRQYFPAWDSFPADAQLGIHSMGYAMGAGFPATFPKFVAACNRGDWTTASVECVITHNPPVARNAANVHLFQNAAKAKNASTLYWPGIPGGASGTLLTVSILALLGGYGAWRVWKGGGA